MLYHRNTGFDINVLCMNPSQFLSYKILGDIVSTRVNKEIHRVPETLPVMHP